MRPILSAALALLALAGCENTVRTTSGADWLAAAPLPQATAPAPTKRIVSTTGAVIEEGPPVTEADLIRLAAGVEPTLSFPARIGVARIEDGRLVGLPLSEANVWRDLGTSLQGVAEIEPLDPALASLTASTLPRLGATDRSHRGGHDPLMTARLGAARQHLDVLLAYEVESGPRRDLGRTDRKVMGVPVPVKDEDGHARALMIDVRNGYPYATLTAHEEVTSASVFAGREARERAASEADGAVTRVLAREVELALAKLAARLGPVASR